VIHWIHKSTGGLRSPFFYGDNMNLDFLHGEYVFKKPHIQFNKPSLEGYILGFKNKDLFFIVQEKKSQKIPVDQIWVTSTPPEDRRLLKADTSYPVWVVDGLVNENGERYTLIDGKHRITILKNSGYTEVNCIVFSVEDIKKVLRIVGKR